MPSERVTTLAVRERALRRTVTVGRAREIIERRFGLPAGSVHIVLPEGRAPRSDQTIGRLRERWALSERPA